MINIIMITDYNVIRVNVSIEERFELTEPFFAFESNIAFIESEAVKGI